MKRKYWMLIISVLVIAGFAAYHFQYFLQDKTYGTVPRIQGMTAKRSVHTATLLHD